ncbi:MAG: gamma-glutamyl-gamma-aminobutyrate hydrolase family protein [Gammaproteobacteria bacterium]|nr:gamma-glutamyl-gamma-aminobutyrate hydrolase family protein [Gammaproteobacteria bacterium]MDE2250752.1 gamma-glutamyl-gamma-aminobutyrate hydrolase family protein [Gammaproteobacteria bacterium]
MSARRPLIGIPADRRMLGPQPYHLAGEKYVTAALDAAGAIPVIVPALGRELQDESLLASLDGLLFTGSPSNVEPHRYRGEPSEAGTLHDPHRDETTLPLIPRAVAAGVPVLGICRGFQEMNVAFGGTLWQKLHEVPGHLDHREDKEQPLERQYGAAHEIVLEPGGMLQRLAGGAARVTVNSLHGQGVRDLGPGLAIEARAPDGVIEAFRVRGARRFALAVQWHPEWRVQDNKFSQALFAEFGAACREQMQAR